jgi:hypothetical protein
MNHRQRASAAVEAGIPAAALLRISRVELAAIVEAVVVALRQCERDARREGIRSAANAAADRITDRELRHAVIDSVLALEKRRPRGARR